MVIGYRDPKGVEREVRVDWRVVTAASGPARPAGRSGSGGMAYALDPAAETRRRAKKLLFAPTCWPTQPGQRAAAASRRPSTAAPRRHRRLVPDTDFQDTVAAKVGSDAAGRFGYLRALELRRRPTMSPSSTRWSACSGCCPHAGLIIDLRGNPGGLIWAAERLLQLFTPRRVEPTRFSLLATALTRAMAAAPQNLASSSRGGGARGGVAPASSTPGPCRSRRPSRCNDIGQVYGGPVVAVVDANTYSSGDLFAAGFVDNEIGMLVSVGEATGAGGANVW